MIMELDELKSQLNLKLATDHAGRSDDDIARLLQKRTHSAVEKIKRSLLFEIRLCLPFILLFILIGIFSKDRSFNIYFSVFAVFFVGILFVLLYLLKRTRNLSEDPLPVKENLQMIVTIIDEFIKRCFQISLIMVPVGIIFVGLLEFNFKETAKISSRFAKGYFSSTWQVMAFMAVYTAVFTGVMYFFAKWYLHKLYGKYVAQLKACIRELEE
jgi:hypothetical protein